jgi:hypothetical protein
MGPLPIDGAASLFLIAENRSDRALLPKSFIKLNQLFDKGDGAFTSVIDHYEICRDALVNRH